MVHTLHAAAEPALYKRNSSPCQTTLPRLTVLIDAPTKEKLEILSEETDQTISQVIRKLIRDHLQQCEERLEVASRVRDSEES